MPAPMTSPTRNPVATMANKNLTEAEKNEILDYELMVYVCSGNDREKLDWFSTINIAGLKLSAPRRAFRL